MSSLTNAVLEDIGMGNNVPQFGFFNGHVIVIVFRDL